MSHALTAAAWRATLGASPKIVLLALCDHADDLGECFVGVPLLVERCSLSERAVQKQLADLVKLSYIERVLRPGRASIFRVRDPRTWCTPQQVHPAQDAPQPPHVAHPAPRASRTTCTTPPHHVHPAADAPPHLVHPSGAPGAGEGAPGAGEGAPGAPVSFTQALPNPVYILEGARADADAQAPARIHAREDGAADTPGDGPQLMPNVRASMALIRGGIPAHTANAWHPQLVELTREQDIPDEWWADAGRYAVAMGKGFAYAVGVVANRLADKQRAPTPASTQSQATHRPSVTDSFRGKTYAGTPDDQLPPEFRDAAP